VIDMADKAEVWVRHEDKSFILCRDIYERIWDKSILVNILVNTLYIYGKNIVFSLCDWLSIIYFSKQYTMYSNWFLFSNFVINFLLLYKDFGAMRALSASAPACACFLHFSCGMGTL
jgi:hypothetical protein